MIPTNYRPDCSACEPIFGESDRSVLELVDGGPHIRRRPILDARRNIWLPDYTLTPLETMGGDWPAVVIDKFEENRLGERRYVGSRIAEVRE